MLGRTLWTVSRRHIRASVNLGERSPKFVVDGVATYAPSSTSVLTLTRRHYSPPLSKEEEEKEKARVASLSPFQKEMELRELDRKLAKLHMLRGINSGDLYTLRGKLKHLARDYGVGFMVWYWTVWCSMAMLTYGAIEVGGIDAIAILAKADTWIGTEISTKVDPTLGTIGLTIAVNELLEPVRLPIVVFTTKPVVHFFGGTPHY